MIELLLFAGVHVQSLLCQNQHRNMQ